MSRKQSGAENIIARITKTAAYFKFLNDPESSNIKYAESHCDSVELALFMP